jgi:hypothetical protein
LPAASFCFYRNTQNKRLNQHINKNVSNITNAETEYTYNM